MNDCIHYGETWRRLAAGLVDATLLAVPVGVAWALMPADPAQTLPAIIVFASGLVMFYRMILEGSTWQATPGKRLLDLKVTAPDGAQLSYANTAVRGWPFWLPGAMTGVTGQLIPALVVICVAALLLIPLTARRQGLHDLTARTIVVRRHVEFQAAGGEPPTG